MDTCLIPAAGFGKRVGSPPAKELLKDPQTGRPLIDWSIELAHEQNLRPVVITRQDKVELISYLEKKVELVLIDESREWPDSILRAQESWGERNLLLLPDTRFAPKEIVGELLGDCLSVGASFAYFETQESLSQWGVVDFQDGLKICEKPRGAALGRRPWGLIAFQKRVGISLFENLLESNRSHEFFSFDFSYKLRQLQFFKDITRNISDLEPFFAR